MLAGASQVAAGAEDIPKDIPFGLRIGRVGICVADLQLAIKFYTALGYDKGDLMEDASLSDLLELENVVTHISHRPKNGIEIELVQFGPA